MEKINGLFLMALKASLKNKTVSWEGDISAKEWEQLFTLAKEHHVLPMIYEAVFRCPAAGQTAGTVLPMCKRQMIQNVMMQTLKTEEFSKLYNHLKKAQVQPLVVKGIICRNLYPNPDYRISGDEDILTGAEYFETMHEAMLQFGMQLMEPEKDIEKEYEVSYNKQGSPIYIEAHKTLFSPESDAYGDLNKYFADVWKNKKVITINGTEYFTLGDTDHLFYLICHVFKHFLHGGFGIRQVCDIVLYANTYGKSIDWKKLLKNCREIRAEKFTAALFQIGEKYLTFDKEKAGYPKEWQQISVDETAMLEDLIAGGVYGGAQMSRKHSSNMTLQAVSAQKQGKKQKNFVLKTIFPSARDLQGRYPYLQKKPYLLPAAWASRILRYRKEIKSAPDNQAAEAVKIGNQRIELLKRYEIIEKNQ